MQHFIKYFRESTQKTDVKKQCLIVFKYCLNLQRHTSFENHIATSKI